VEQKDVAIVGIQLAEHVEVKQSSLPQKIVWLPNYVHQQFQSCWILDFVIVVNH
jgi:hypothetical protein